MEFKIIIAIRKIIFILPLLILGFVLPSCGQSETNTRAQVEADAENVLQNLSEEDKAKLVAKTERAGNYFKTDKLVEAYESKGLTISEKQKIEISLVALRQFFKESSYCFEFEPEVEGGHSVNGSSFYFV